MEINLTANLGVPAELTKPLADANAAIHDARPVLQGYQNGFWILAAVTLLTVAAIVLVNMKPAPIGFTLGAVLALSGAAGLVGGLLTLGTVRSMFAGGEDFPASLVPWVHQLVSALFQPFIIFSVVCLIAGFALLVMGFITRGREPSDMGLRVNMGGGA
jgi:hypothetical protein